MQTPPLQRRTGQRFTEIDYSQLIIYSFDLPDVSEAMREASLRNHRLSMSHQPHPSAAPQPAQIPIHRNVLSENDAMHAHADGAVGGAVGGSAAVDDVVFRNKLKHMGKCK